jgi:hypothetical protein
MVIVGIFSWLFSYFIVSIKQVSAHMLTADQWNRELRNLIVSAGREAPAFCGTHRFITCQESGGIQ